MKIPVKAGDEPKLLPAKAKEPLTMGEAYLKWRETTRIVWLYWTRYTKSQFAGARDLAYMNYLSALNDEAAAQDALEAASA